MKNKSIFEEDDHFDALTPEKALKQAAQRLKEIEKELPDAEKKHAGIQTLAEAYLTQVGRPFLVDPTLSNDVAPVCGLAHARRSQHSAG